MSILRYGLPLYCPVRTTEEDPVPGALERIRVVFNDCIRLLTNNSRRDHARINDMLTQLDWLSINQLSAETRLIEAWKTAEIDDYCLTDILKVKESLRNTRSGNNIVFNSSQANKFSGGSFMHRTATLWNQAPKSIKESKTLAKAKEEIRKYARTLPI